MTLKDLYVAACELTSKGRVSVSVEIGTDGTVQWRLWSLDYGGLTGSTPEQLVERLHAVVGVASVDAQSVDEASDTVGLP